MNATEERLRGALQSVGGTLGPADVPPLRASRGPRRAAVRGAVRRPVLVASAVVASAVVAVGGAVAGGVLSAGHEAGSLSAAPTKPDVSVFLCTRTSANVTCGHKDATPAQREDIRQRIKVLSSVREVRYESKQEAYERVKKLYESRDESRVLPRGDIPDSFRLTVREGADTARIQVLLSRLPGVDTVIVERRLPPG